MGHVRVRLMDGAIARVWVRYMSAAARAGARSKAGIDITDRVRARVRVSLCVGVRVRVCDLVTIKVRVRDVRFSRSQG